MHKPLRFLPAITLRNVRGSSYRLSTQIPNKQSTDQQRDLKSADPVLRVKDYFRDLTGNTAVSLRKRADGFTASTETLFSQLGSHLNKASGYEDIELLKKKVVEQEARINSARAEASQAKRAYEEAVIQRSQSQREVNELLQRKSNWTDFDVGRFTTLVREDHMYEQTEAKAKERVAESDAQVDQELNELLRSILSRYHEEQIWSDKIRSASTYGSLAALGLNLLVFIMATLVVEPWKRNRLAQTFERKVEELSAQTREMIEMEMQRVHQRMDQTLALPPPPSPQVFVVDENRSLLERLKKDVELQILLGAVIAGWIVNIFQ